MTNDDRARAALHEALDGALGEDHADTLMGYLPPVGWADVATKRDLDAQSLITRKDLDSSAAMLRAELQAEMAGLRHEVSTEFAAVRHDMATGLAAVRHDLTEGLTAVRHDMATELAAVRQDLTSEFGEIDVRFEGVNARFEAHEKHLERAMRHQTAWLVTAMTATVGAFAVLTQILS